MQNGLLYQKKYGIIASNNYDDYNLEVDYMSAMQIIGVILIIVCVIEIAVSLYCRFKAKKSDSDTEKQEDDTPEK